MTQIQCLKCKDIIESSNGELVRCTCGAIFIDETSHYCRKGGLPELIKEVHVPPTPQ